ncbi:MAG: glutamate racemase [Defluviitaleaceae bacterium]|nr:glutamate racemase [Defluviitaleaceae bacterium]
MLGVFDSGVGGLTVVKELRRLIPQTSIIYVGDTARAPYGGKDEQILFIYGREIIRFLLKKGAKAIVMACGTSSSVSLEPLRKEFPGLPIIDTIRPAVKTTLLLAQQSHDFKPVFAATETTVKSGVFQKLFYEEEKNCKLYVRACPLFAPMVEAGLTKNNPLLNFAAENYFSDLRGKVNALILGCTHYPLLTDALTRTLGEIIFINPATATAEATREILPPPPENSPAIIEYYTSGNPKNFAKIAQFILNEKCTAKKASF